VVLTMLLGTIGPAAGAQAPAPLHDSQYSEADITYGAALYASNAAF